MHKALLLLLFIGVLVSCASSDSEDRPRLPTDAEVAYYNSIAPEEDHITCFTRTELGSRFPRRYCYRIADLEAQRDQGQAVVDLMQIDGLLDSPFELR